MKQKLLKIYFLLLMEWSKRKDSDDKTWLIQCCSCYGISHRTMMLWWHFIPQSRWRMAKVLESNIHAQHPNCNANQHREGKNGDQYRYGQRLDRQYWEGTAEFVIQETTKLYEYTVLSISEDIDILLGKMDIKLATMNSPDLAHQYLKKRLWVKIYKILFEEDGSSENLIAFFKKK